MASNIDYRTVKKSRMPFLILSHPFEAFIEMRYNKKGSMTIANIILAAFFFVTVFSQQYTAFVFNSYRPESLNLFKVFAISIGVFLLWVIGNMSVTSLTEGEGTYKDVWINTAYGLVPYILFSIIAVGASHIFVLEEQVFYSMFGTIGLLWSGFLIVLGIKTAHQFTMRKTISSILLSIVAMLIIVFMIILIMALISEMTGFGDTIITELKYRT